MHPLTALSFNFVLGLSSLHLVRFLFLWCRQFQKNTQFKQVPHNMFQHNASSIISIIFNASMLWQRLIWCTYILFQITTDTDNTYYINFNLLNLNRSVRCTLVKVGMCFQTCIQNLKFTAQTCSVLDWSVIDLFCNSLSISKHWFYYMYLNIYQSILTYWCWHLTSLLAADFLSNTLIDQRWHNSRADWVAILQFYYHTS